MSDTAIAPRDEPLDPTAAARAIGAELERRYRAIAEGPMADLPVINPALAVAAVGFVGLEGRAVGIVTTPWFMNVMVTALPGFELSPARIGDPVLHSLPSGDYECVVGTLDGFGRIDSVSLFSPMFDFADQETALAAAEAAIAEILTAPEPEPAPVADAPALDRRSLFFGRRAAPSEGRP
jgi:[NiFe] hydrogenase assembly HybE family chaperone